MSTSKKSGASQPPVNESQKQLDPALSVNGEAKPQTSAHQSQASLGGGSQQQGQHSAVGGESAAKGQLSHAGESQKDLPHRNPSDDEDEDMFNQQGHHAGSEKSKQTGGVMMTGVNMSSHKGSEPNLSHDPSGKTLPTGMNNATPVGGGGRGVSGIPQKPRVDLLPNVYSLFDFIFPGGKLSKLAKIENLKLTNDQLQTITRAFKFTEGAPVIVLAGARNSGKGKFLAGLARAGFRSDAIIVDSGVETGIENYCIRRNVRLVGVFPEGQVTMPKINPTQKYPNQLANGHTHLFMLTGKQLAWGSEARIKFELSKILARGDREGMRLNPVTGALKPINRDPSCKTVYIVLGDCEINEWIEDVRIAVQHQLPIILIKGSKMCDAMIDHINGKSQLHHKHTKWSAVDSDQLQNQSKTQITAVLASLLQDGHFYGLETGKSEDLAAFAHFFLTVTPYGQSKRDWQKDLEGAGHGSGDKGHDKTHDKPQVKPAEPKPASTPKAGDTKQSLPDDKSAKKSKVADEPIPSDDKSAKSKSNKK